MAYWESTERYDSRRPDIWAELCGEHIRHHKMPTEEIHETLQLTNSSGTAIRVLGVEFENIERPKFNDGSYIPNIVGYEILRGSREGAKSILGKGIFKNINHPFHESIFAKNATFLPVYRLTRFKNSKSLRINSFSF